MSVLFTLYAFFTMNKNYVAIDSNVERKLICESYGVKILAVSPRTAHFLFTRGPRDDAHLRIFIERRDSREFASDLFT